MKYAALERTEPGMTQTGKWPPWFPGTAQRTQQIIHLNRQTKYPVVGMESIVVASSLKAEK
jgi:hypothetical protein